MINCNESNIKEIYINVLNYGNIITQEGMIITTLGRVYRRTYNLWTGERYFYVSPDVAVGWMMDSA